MSVSFSQTSVQVPRPPSTSNVQGKTIGGLSPLPEALRHLIRSILIPTELHHSTDQQSNFRVSLAELIGAIEKADLGLGQVDNTSDKDKPISDATRTALRGLYGPDNQPGIGDVRNLTETLQGFLTENSTISIEQVENLVEILRDKAEKRHSHTAEDLPWLSDVLRAFAPVDHNHSLSSLTGWDTFLASLNQSLAQFQSEAQVDARIDAKALVVGTYDWQ